MLILRFLRGCWDYLFTFEEDITAIGAIRVHVSQVIEVGGKLISVNRCSLGVQLSSPEFCMIISGGIVGCFVCLMIFHISASDYIVFIRYFSVFIIDNLQQIFRSHDDTNLQPLLILRDWVLIQNSFHSLQCTMCNDMRPLPGIAHHGTVLGFTT